MCHFSEKTIQEMLERCSSLDVNWLESDTSHNPAAGCGNPAGGCDVVDTIPQGGAIPSVPFSSVPFRKASMAKGTGNEVLAEARRVELCTLFRRRSETRWTDGELKAFRSHAAGCLEDDFKVLCEYYRAQIPDGDYRRRDLSTLLNNFPGEIDRAKAWKIGRHRPSNDLSNLPRNSLGMPMPPLV